MIRKPCCVHSFATGRGFPLICAAGKPSDLKPKTVWMTLFFSLDGQRRLYVGYDHEAQEFMTETEDGACKVA